MNLWTFLSLCFIKQRKIHCGHWSAQKWSTAACDGCYNVLYHWIVKFFFCNVNILKYCNRWCWHERYIVKDEWVTAIAGQVYRSWLILMKCLYCKLLNLHLFMHYNEEHRAMIHNWLNMCITCVIYNLEQSHTCLIHLCLFAFYLDRIIYLFIGFRVCTSNNCLYWYVFC